VVLVSLIAASNGLEKSNAPNFSTERTDHLQMFKEWMAYYKKSYTGAEMEQRFFVFVDWIQRTKEMNKKHNTNAFGITKFSDMTSAEFRAKYLMAPGEYKPPQLTTNLTLDEQIKQANPRGIKLSSIAGLHDWGQEGYTTAVKNQLQCGSCWAFSATEQIESNWAMKHGLPQPLSPQQIVDCDRSDSGCGGGWPYRAYGYVQGAGGLETDAAYPYTGQNGNCQDNGQKVVQITGYQPIGVGDEPSMFKFLDTGGPISICLNANNLQSYQGNNAILPANTCDPSDVDHCTQLTGWLADDSGNIQAWNLRNSWGTDWGNAGYAFIIYGQNACNLDSSPTYVTV